MNIKPFRAADLAALALQPAQAHFGAMLADPAYGAALQSAGPAFTAFDGDAAIGCAGLVWMWPGRAHAWALLGACGPRPFIGVHRAVRRFLDGALGDPGVRRIETAVDHDFAAGHRWARALGFQHEGAMRAYGVDGRDADLYARIRAAAEQGD